MKKLLAALLLTLSAGVYAHITQAVLYDSPTDAAMDSTPDLNTQAPQPNVDEPQIMSNPETQDQSGADNTQIANPETENQPSGVSVSPREPDGPYY